MIELEHLSYRNLTQHFAKKWRKVTYQYKVNELAEQVCLYTASSSQPNWGQTSMDARLNTSGRAHQVVGGVI